MQSRNSISSHACPKTTHKITSRRFVRHQITHKNASRKFARYQLTCKKRANTTAR